jgi:hypothetical protein
MQRKRDPVDHTSLPYSHSLAGRHLADLGPDTSSSKPHYKAFDPIVSSQDLNRLTIETSAIPADSTPGACSFDL